MKKKSWIKPELIVLVRNISDENVLAKCKNAQGIIIIRNTLVSSSNPRSSDSSCMRRVFNGGGGHGGGHGGLPKVCVICTSPFS